MTATASKAFGYVRGEPVALELGPIGGGFYLRRDAAEAFIKMQLAASSAGARLTVTSAFRTFEQQQQLFNAHQEGTGSLAAAPGFSNHQAGIAVDIETAIGRNAAFEWLTENAATYGFRRTVASEPWHWEWRGW